MTQSIALTRAGPALAQTDPLVPNIVGQWVKTIGKASAGCDWKNTHPDGPF